MLHNVHIGSLLAYQILNYVFNGIATSIGCLAMTSTIIPLLHNGSFSHQSLD